MLTLFYLKKAKKRSKNLHFFFSISLFSQFVSWLLQGAKRSQDPPLDSMIHPISIAVGDFQTAPTSFSQTARHLWKTPTPVFFSSRRNFSFFRTSVFRWENDSLSRDEIVMFSFRKSGGSERWILLFFCSYGEIDGRRRDFDRRNFR